MHRVPVLQKFSSESLPDVHAHRLTAVSQAVDAVAQGARVAITAMGCGLGSNTRTNIE